MAIHKQCKKCEKLFKSEVTGVKAYDKDKSTITVKKSCFHN